MTLPFCSTDHAYIIDGTHILKNREKVEHKYSQMCLCVCMLMLPLFAVLRYYVCVGLLQSAANPRKVTDPSEPYQHA